MSYFWISGTGLERANPRGAVMRSEPDQSSDFSQPILVPSHLQHHPQGLLKLQSWEKINPSTTVKIILKRLNSSFATQKIMRYNPGPIFLLQSNGEPPHFWTKKTYTAKQGLFFGLTHLVLTPMCQQLQQQSFSVSRFALMLNFFTIFLWLLANQKYTFFIEFISESIEAEPGLIQFMTASQRDLISHPGRLQSTTYKITMSESICSLLKWTNPKNPVCIFMLSKRNKGHEESDKYHFQALHLDPRNINLWNCEKVLLVEIRNSPFYDTDLEDELITRNKPTGVLQLNSFTSPEVYSTVFSPVASFRDRCCYFLIGRIWFLFFLSELKSIN
ncbi:hypothetical protein VP01_433g4 [Puccinia sorghi]|uniref:Uncharacterized protein n=1 Tax=Puccinia sorghi TaxID=27349 RepID=A0A0L6URW5_9BASI|nr:hypothetical protein VP01_433g4 [Puccinia sorghi]